MDAAEAPDVPTYADVEAAARRLEGVAHRTPVVTSRALDARTGAQAFLKCENLQRAGAFKFRGAYNALARLDAGARGHGVVAFSSGNHAQAVALAGQITGTRTVIVMPTDAPAMKVEATRGYGGEVVFYDRYTEDREAIGRKLAIEGGLTLVPPFDHADVIAGQGTAARELFAETGPLDLLLVCTGGGGLLAGSALTAAVLSPDCRVIGVEPEAGDDVRRSLRSDAIVQIPVPVSIADGALTTRMGDRTFAIARRLVSDVVTVSDAQLVDTMRFVLERLKMVAEPTGCLALAALLAGIVPAAGQRVGVLVSGGNVDTRVLARLLA